MKQERKEERREDKGRKEKEKEGNRRGGKERGKKRGKSIRLVTCRNQSLFIVSFYIFLISKIRLIF